MNPLLRSEHGISSVLAEYRIVLAPLLVGAALLASGYVLDVMGFAIEAGVSSAIGLVVLATSVLAYGALWLLEKLER